MAGGGVILTSLAVCFVPDRDHTLLLLLQCACFYHHHFNCPPPNLSPPSPTQCNLLNASIACLSSNGGSALLCVVTVTTSVPMIPNAQAAATAAAGALVTNATSVTYFDESNQVAAIYTGSCVQHSQPFSPSTK